MNQFFLRFRLKIDSLFRCILQNISYLTNYLMNHLVNFIFYSPVPNFVNFLQEVKNYAQFMVKFQSLEEAEYARFCRYDIEPLRTIIITQMYDAGNLQTGMDDELYQHLSHTYIEGTYIETNETSNDKIDIIIVEKIEIPDHSLDFPIDGITIPPPIKTNRLSCIFYSCDICAKNNNSQNELFSNGIYTCDEQNLDCCIRCAETDAGKQLLSQHIFILLPTGEEPYLILKRNLIRSIKVAKDANHQNIDGIATIHYKKRGTYIGGFKNNEKHGDGIWINQMGDDYPNHIIWFLYDDGIKIISCKLNDLFSSNQQINNVYLDKMRDTRKNKCDKYLLPEKILETYYKLNK